MKSDPEFIENLEAAVRRAKGRKQSHMLMSSMHRTRIYIISGIMSSLRKVPARTIPIAIPAIEIWIINAKANLLTRVRRRVLDDL